MEVLKQLELVSDWRQTNLLDSRSHTGPASHWASIAESNFIPTTNPAKHNTTSRNKNHPRILGFQQPPPNPTSELKLGFQQLPPTSELELLPLELQHRIFEYLDAGALREVSRSSRHMHGVVDGAYLVWKRTFLISFGLFLDDL